MWEGSAKARAASEEDSRSASSKEGGEEKDNQRFNAMVVFKRVAALAEVEARRAKSLAAALAKEKNENKALRAKVTTLQHKHSM